MEHIVLFRITGGLMKNSHEVKRSLFLSSVKAQIAWGASAVILLLLFSLIAYNSADPDSLILPLSLCALYLSAVIGGFAAVRLSGDGIMSGLLSGLITIVLIRLLALLPFPNSYTELSLSILYTLLVFPASVVGSILGHKRKDKIKRRKIAR